MKGRGSIILYLIIAALVLAALYINLLSVPKETSEPEQIACTQEARMCPDGSSVGREGLACEFATCPSVEVGEDVRSQIEEKSDLIQVISPQPGNLITSTLHLSGEARGYWFFEATAPIVLVDWDGSIIAESYITAEGEWMTEEMVPFSGTIEFESPYQEGDDAFMQRGALIFQKANPSDLSENDDAVEIPIAFVPRAATSTEE